MPGLPLPTARRIFPPKLLAVSLDTMSREFEGQTVLVTGASSGIGEACARRFAAGGARLILCARRQDRIEVLARQLQDEHKVESLALRVDVRDKNAVMQTFSGRPPEWRGVDVLVNNAGLARSLRPVFEQDMDEFDDMIDTNIKGLLYATRLIVPEMLERGRGHVINIGSTAGHEAYPGGTVYCATKYAVRAISEGLKMDLHGTPIRVSSVDPGFVETEFSLTRFGGDKERADRVYRGMEALTADDIARLVCFCAAQPPHVNVSNLLVMPVDQSSASLINRRSES